MITFIFAGCKKFDEIEASKVEIIEENIEKEWDNIKISAQYNYPVELETVKIYLSEKEDMSGATMYECTLDGKKFNVEFEGLKAGTVYYFYYEYDNGYVKEKSTKSNLKTISKPDVVTKDVTNITTKSAVLNGSLTNSDDANKIIERGFCWGTKKTPTIEGNHTSTGSDTGIYSYSLTNLTNNTTYYVRSYVKTNFGIVYGEEKIFTTVEIVLPTVTTNSVTDIKATTATCGGNITSDGNGTVTARGICWSTNPNPTINDNKTNNGSGIGSFTSNLSNLASQTTYYVRAYAINEVGTAYGEEVSFTTLEEHGTGDENEEDEITLPTVTTNSVTDIKATTATCGGNITSDGNGTVTARGICWSANPNPTINDNKTTNGEGLGSFTSNLSNLASQTTYYVRAYAINEVGTAYGEEVSFTTLERNANGREYVDLGLRVKWATCNVGATSPEEYGDYFAWGETMTKETYTEDNCPTYGVSKSELQSQGIIDSEGNLTSQYDAAQTNWGGSWRMPTKAELEELLDECTWTWTKQNSVNGYKVTGPNGNSIFLPAAGYRSGSSLYGAGGYGDYWSSTPYDYYDYDAYFLGFGSSNHVMRSNYRILGLSVRPILE